MSERMSGERLGFPAAVHARLRLEAGFLPKPGEQPIGLELQEVLAIQIRRVLERAIEQLDVVQVEGLELRRRRRGGHQGHHRAQHQHAKEDVTHAHRARESVQWNGMHADPRALTILYVWQARRRCGLVNLIVPDSRVVRSTDASRLP